MRHFFKSGHNVECVLTVLHDTSFRTQKSGFKQHLYRLELIRMLWMNTHRYNKRHTE